MKVQLNIFLRTDFYYGNDEFCLSEMPDCYKDEFTAASDWLKFGFHSKQEFPDYPFVNASYEDVKALLDETKAEVFRFAGEKSFAYAVVPHWLPISREGCHALKDCGVKITSATIGDRVIVGMGAVVLDGAKIGDNCLVGAGSLVTGKMDAPAGSMILGSPARVVRALTEEEIEDIRESMREYLALAEDCRRAT
jgi:hypothetical protein